MLDTYVIVASLILNVALFVYILYKHRQPAKQVKRHSIEAEEMLHHMTKYGSAVVKISVIDPTSILIHKR